MGITAADLFVARYSGLSARAPAQRGKASPDSPRKYSISILGKLIFMEKNNHIKIWADYHSNGIFDFRGHPLRKPDISLPDVIWDDLRKWCLSYEYVIRMSVAERNEILEKIALLDKEGMRIRDEIRKISTMDFQIHYYSEGLFKYLDEKNISGLIPVDESNEE